MARPKRKDKTRTVLRTGELQRSDVKRIVLVNLDLIDEYLEAFRDEEF